MTTQQELFTALPKPPYEIASMEERRRRPRNGLTAVSTFSGCGGSSLGLWSAGWSIPYAAEFVDVAAETYSANFPDTFVDVRDVREITGGEIRNRLDLEVGELDLLEGSPPCSSFSTANVGTTQYGAAKEKHYTRAADGTNIRQQTDDLFPEWLRLVDELKPRAVLAENVVGLWNGRLEGKDGIPGRRVIEVLLLEPLRDLGYRAAAFAPVKSSEYGAATARPRLYVVGYREDVGRTPVAPRTAPHRYTMRDAFETIPGERDRHGDLKLSDTDLLALYYGPALAAEWARLGPGESPEGYAFQLVKVDIDKPAPTFVATYGAGRSPGPSHDLIPRQFHADEMSWLSGFPSDYVWPGTLRENMERIARAVTPPVYEAFGRHIARDLGAI